MLSVGLYVSLALAANPPATSLQQKPIVIQVLSLAAENGVDPASAKVVTDFLSTELGLHKNVKVFGTSDIQALLREAHSRETMGCNSAADECLSEIAGALGAQWLVVGTVGRLGEALVLNVRVLDTLKHQVLAQAHRITGTEQSNLLTAVDEIVPDLFGQLQPGAQEKGRSAVPFILGTGAIVGGLAFAIGGSIAGVNELNNASIRSAYLASNSLPSGYGGTTATYSSTQNTVRNAALVADIGLILFVGLGIATAVTW